MFYFAHTRASNINETFLKYDLFFYEKCICTEYVSMLFGAFRVFQNAGPYPFR